MVNGKFLSQRMTGVQRYAAEIVRAWDHGYDEGWIDRNRYRIQVLAPADVLHNPEYRNIQLVRCSTRGRAWEQLELPWRSRGHLLFSPYAAAPILKRRHFVTIHDAGAAATPSQYSLQFRAYYSAVYRILGKTCTTVFTVSDFSKKELQRHFAIANDKIKIVSPGCDYLLKVASDPSVLANNGLLRHRYVLGVSSRSTIKNFEGLAKAWKLIGRTDLKLAIAGGTNSRIFGGQASNGDSDIVRLGYVSDGELRALYENAAVFAYPSFYEGFGLPPIEAMGCGCPVVVANTSALPEACGDAALYCNPVDVGDIASKIALLLTDERLSDEMRQRGYAKFGELTTRKAAERLWSDLIRYV